MGSWNVCKGITYNQYIVSSSHSARNVNLNFTVEQNDSENPLQA